MIKPKGIKVRWCSDDESGKNSCITVLPNKVCSACMEKNGMRNYVDMCTMFHNSDVPEDLK
jgi:hypothetical protein